MRKVQFLLHTHPIALQSWRSEHRNQHCCQQKGRRGMWSLRKPVNHRAGKEEGLTGSCEVMFSTGKASLKPSWVTGSSLVTSVSSSSGLSAQHQPVGYSPGQTARSEVLTGSDPMCPLPPAPLPAATRVPHLPTALRSEGQHHPLPIH